MKGEPFAVRSSILRDFFHTHREGGNIEPDFRNNINHIEIALSGLFSNAKLSNRIQVSYIAGVGDEGSVSFHVCATDSADKLVLRELQSFIEDYST